MYAVSSGPANLLVVWSVEHGATARAGETAVGFISIYQGFW